MQQEITINESVHFSYLNKMACNTTVHIQILTPTKAIRLKTQLIGVDPHMSIILAMRNDQEWSTARNYIREGQGAIIRLMSLDKPEAGILAFRTNIQKIMNISGNWLVMDYPKALQKVSLRKHSRIAIKTACAIIDKNTQTQLSLGYLHDISINGCAFIGELLAGGTLSSEYNLQVKLSAEKNELVIPVIIKNSLEIDRYSEQQQYGLAFQNNSQETLNFIQKVVLHHLSL